MLDSPSSTAGARCAVITGATGGIGRATASALAAADWELILTDRDERALAALADELLAEGASRVRTVVGDVLDATLGDRLASEVTAGGVALRGLVNCAGIIDGHSLESLSDERWQQLFDVNVTSQFRITRALSPLLRAAGGAAVVNLSSILGLRAGPSMPGYCMTKAAIIGLSKSMAVDFAPDAVRVNALCPGAIDTAMPRSLLAQMQLPAEAFDGFAAEYVQRNLIKRLGRAQEVADVIAFLLSDKACFITGLALPIDGGLSAC